MIQWEAFAALCGYLRVSLLDGTRSRRERQPSWELLMRISSLECVTPALAWCLRGQPGVPPEIGDYLGSMLALNERRNGHLLDALARVAGALNAIGIEPMLLKGAARLVEGCYPAAGIRFLGDLDVLIPTERSVDAFRALQSASFETRTETEALPPDHHHLPMLHDRRTGAGVELHTAVTSEIGETVIPTSYFADRTRSAAFRDHRVRLPDATRSIAHIIVHDQLQHGYYRSGRCQLRQLLDLAVIRQRCDDAIDWTDLDGRFGSAGHGSVLATYLKFAKVLLGQDVPPLQSAPRPGAVEDFCRAVDPAGMRRRGIFWFALLQSEVRHHSGNCWVATLPAMVFPGDSSTSPTCSALELFENDESLGPPHSGHDLIRTEGKGAFSHWGNDLYFSTSDNADPRTCGRTFSVRAPAVN